MTLSALARPKVNLTLTVEGKRPDGYHLLQSIVCFASGGDRVTVALAHTLSLKITGPFAGDLDAGDGDNLILRAARLLQDTMGGAPGAAITLEKNLPVASGIGGGSADAAATLQLLCALWNLELSPDELAKIGLTLGADVPACLMGLPLMMSGIGEDLAPLKAFPHLHMLLVNPGKAVATPAVFRALNWQAQTTEEPAEPERESAPPPPTNSVTLQHIHAGTNDLQAPAISLIPEISAVLTLMAASDGAHLARMSGSGATCFALFESDAALQKAALDIKALQPHWWVYPASVAAVGAGS